MERSNVIYLVPDIEGEMHAINASNIEGLIFAGIYEVGETEYDTVIAKHKDGYNVILLPAGTIEQRFDSSIWKSKYIKAG
jgi:hypothetical protein|uniref:Uncharacterized protein n=1 Tax=Myoviridae sp. cte0p10 TaxID=2826674 RepID=A0A8S5NGP3_9CAUD|nr:MAG TPA: hypothetical protein [Myoviridae sp. cte0p10]